MLRAAVLALAIASIAAPASAQSPSELAAARQLFEQGLAAAREERWDDARGSFERSLAIAERPSTLLNLAGAQAQTGRLVDAAASYRRFLEIAGEREARHRAGAEAALAAVEARLAHVTVELEGASDGDRVELDDGAITPGDALAVDPGSHTVVVIRGDEEVARRTVALAEGQSETVTLAVRAARPDPEELAAPDPAPAPAGGEDLTWVWVGVGAGAAVVVAVAIGVGVGVATSQPTFYTGNLGDGMIRF